MPSFDRTTAQHHGVALALIVSYLKETGGEMSIKDLRQYMNIKYQNALRYISVHQEKGNIIGIGEPTKSGWYEKYSVSDDIKTGGPLVERK